MVVIGGGYIGMEVGSNLSKHGLDVTLVYPEKHLMERLFTPEIASFYEEVYKSKGIQLKPESLATSFEGQDGKVRLLCSLPECSTGCRATCWLDDPSAWPLFGTAGHTLMNRLVLRADAHTDLQRRVAVVAERTYAQPAPI